MICYLSRNYRGVNGAGNKAKTDIEQIMESHGFRNVGFRQTRYTNVVIAFCFTLFSVIKSVFSLRKGDVLVLQYPLKKYYTFVCCIAHFRGCKVITIIHDLGSFRGKRLTVSQEIARLDNSDCIIVHCEPMRNWLIEKGSKANIEILEIFDYLSEKQISYKNALVGQPYQAVFAGVLTSSHNDFLYLLANSSRSYGLVLYGGGLEQEKLLKEVRYKGFVSSDDLIETAEGDFGIVWYGPTLEGGEGPLGEYLQYNAPHKMSLYIRCGLPVVIWEKAGLASFVRKNGIGVCVGSLKELENIFAQMSVERYMELKNNVQGINEKISQGFYFYKAVQQCCTYLGVQCSS